MAALSVLTLYVVGLRGRFEETCYLYMNGSINWEKDGPNSFTL